MVDKVAMSELMLVVVNGNVNFRLLFFFFFVLSLVGKLSYECWGLAWLGR